jgi:hypothetical protein
MGARRTRKDLRLDPHRLYVSRWYDPFFNGTVDIGNERGRDIWKPRSIAIGKFQPGSPKVEQPIPSAEPRVAGFLAFIEIESGGWI